MTLQTIPVAGDKLSDGFPSVEKIVKCTFGAIAGDVTSTASGTFAICNVAPYAQVTDVGWMVETLFGQNVAITIGDTDDPNGWAETQDVVASVANTTIYWASRISMGEGSTADDSGPIYAITPPTWTDCEENINVVVSTSFSSQNTGELAVYVKYHMAYAQKYF